MASTSVIPPSSRMEASIPFDNTNDSSGNGKPLSNGASFSDSESELSEPADPPMPSVSSSPEETLAPVANHRSRSEEEEDDAAESQDDGDYDMNRSMQQGQDEASTRHSSSDESLRPPKRKAPLMANENEDYIRNNPDLYGLRRSHRARPSRPMLDDSSDQHDSDSDLAVRPRKRLRKSSHQSSKQATPMNGSGGDSDNDSDNYGGVRARLTKKQRRRFMESGGNLAPSHAEVRFSTRKAAKVSNYNEEDDDDFFDQAESEMMTPNYWPAGQEDSRPAIDIVLNHRMKEDITTLSPSKEDFEYLVKWQQKAYYHATWETIEMLTNCRSIRRLENYIKKIGRAHV